MKSPRSSPSFVPFDNPLPEESKCGAKVDLGEIASRSHGEHAGIAQSKTIISTAHFRATAVFLLLLTPTLAQSAKARCSSASAQEQNIPEHFSVLRAYAPKDFRESLSDRLSGGLDQQYPYRMAIDSQRRVLVTDPSLSVVQVLDTKQKKRWQITGDPHHHLGRPAYIAVDADDNIYVTDLLVRAVLVFRPDGQFKRAIGTGTFNAPTGIAVDQQNRQLYVADWWKGQIIEFDLDGNLLDVFGGTGRGPGQLYGPRDIVLHGNTLVVLDSGNKRFQLFDLHGNFRATWPFGNNRRPTAFAFDAADHLYYADQDSGGLVAMDSQGMVVARFDTQRKFGEWVPRYRSPSFMSVVVDAISNVWVLRPTLNVEVVKLVTSAR